MLYLSIFVWCVLSTVVWAQDTNPHLHPYVLDPEKGIIMYPDGDVYIFDNLIYVPVALSMSSRINVHPDAKVNTNGCDILSELKNMVTEVADELKKKIPDIHPIKNFKDLKDFLLHNGKLNISHIPESFNPTPSRKVIEPVPVPKNQQSKDPGVFYIGTTKYSRLTYKRVKRVAWLPIMLGMTLASLGGMAIANRVDIESSKSAFKIIEDNESKLLSKVNDLTEGYTTLSENQKDTLLIIDQAREKINEIIDDHNCLRATYSQQTKLINTWSTMAPNSFIRALNTIFEGRINMDVIPGKYLERLVQYYPDFGGTIFEENPTLIYTSGRSKLIRLNRENLIVEILLVVPRILKSTFGHVYHQKSCHWNSHNYDVTLLHPTTAILSIEEKGWYNPDHCLHEGPIYLCDVKELQKHSSPCLTTEHQWNISDCPLKLEQAYPGEVIQTKNGILVCNPNQTVIQFKRNKIGVVQTTTRIIEKPTLFTQEDADSILVENVHYNLRNDNPILNVTLQYIVHNSLTSSETIKKIPFHHELHYLKPIEKIEHLESYQHYHNWAVYGVILGILIASVSSYILYKKHRGKAKKQLGFLMSRVSLIPKVPAPFSIDQVHPPVESQDAP